MELIYLNTSYISNSKLSYNSYVFVSIVLT